MNLKFPAILGAVLGLALCAPAFAQQGLGGEAAFHNFLENHPRVRSDLVRNPNLVNDPNYVRAHPQISAFYREHPEVRSELGHDAPGFMRAEEWGFKHPAQYNRSHAQWMQGERRGGRQEATDSYFDSHPQVERELQQRPGLAENPNYLKKHPGFARFEQTHPAIAQQFREHPRKFMNSHENYDRREQH